MPILADGGFLWVIVIVGSIIAQIIKAKKNAAASPPKRQPGAKSGDFTASGDELRNFLESIGGGATKPQQTRQPQPIPVRPTALPPSLPPQVTIKHRPSPAETALKHRQVEGTIRKPHTQKPTPPTENIVESLSTTPNVVAQLIKQDLQNMNAARKAIVLREILGPPIALR